MKEYQAPKKLSAHNSSENANRRLKDSSLIKSNKITTKSLNAAFTSVSQNAHGISEESKNSRPMSEISDADGDGETKEVVKFLSEEASSMNLLGSNMIPSKKISDGNGSGSVNFCGASELDSSKLASVEAEIAMKFLRNTQSEVLNSFSSTPQYRELMDEIINFVMKELNFLPEKDSVVQVVSDKNRMVFLCFLMWIIGVSAVIFFSSDTHCSFIGPSPT